MMIWIRLFLTFSLCVLSCSSIEPISTSLSITAAVGLLSASRKCALLECCNYENLKDSWITWDPIASKNWIDYDFVPKLKADLKGKLYGQHIAEAIVVRALARHLADKEPRKALVFSFHGWTGGGKNFVSYLIAKNLYRLGIESKFVHVITATERFPDPLKANEYRVSLKAEIEKHLKECGRQLFIFDEIDKVPDGIMDGLYHLLEVSMTPKEQNKAIYIFLSNTGGSEITRIAYNFYINGMDREGISLQDVESLMSLHAFNEDGGLRKSAIIERNLIDLFVPFLPLERRHVQSCIVDYLEEKYNVTKNLNDKFVLAVANDLDYFPPESKIYSKSGCKKVARKVDLRID